MTGETGIKTAGMHFDDLFGKLQPEGRQNGDHEDLYFEEGKGLFLKNGLGKNWIHDAYINFKRWRSDDAEARCAAFASAAAEIAQSINNQHPGFMVGDLTLGEYIIGSVTQGCEGEYRLNRGYLKQVRQLLEEYKEESELINADQTAEAFNKIGDVSIARSSLSVKTGCLMMKEALWKDLPRDGLNADEASVIKVTDLPSDVYEESYSYDRTRDEIFVAEDPHPADVERFAQAIDDRKGLCRSNLDRIRQELEGAGVTDHPELDKLYGMLSLQNSINVSRRRCMKLNQTLMQDTAAGMPIKFGKELGNMIERRRNIIEALRGLPFPIGFADVETLNDAYNNLLDCACALLELAKNVEDARPMFGRSTKEGQERQKRSVSALWRQARETLCLASSLRSADPKGAVYEKSSTKGRLRDVNRMYPSILFSEKEMGRLQTSLLTGNEKSQKSLFLAQNRDNIHPFKELAKEAFSACNEVAVGLSTFFRNSEDVESQRTFVLALDKAVSANDRLIVDLERRLRIHGGDDSGALSAELGSLLEKRETLGLLKLNVFLAPDHRKALDPHHIPTHDEEMRKLLDADYPDRPDLQGGVNESALTRRSSCDAPSTESDDSRVDDAYFSAIIAEESLADHLIRTDCENESEPEPNTNYTITSGPPEADTDIAYESDDESIGIRDGFGHDDDFLHDETTSDRRLVRYVDRVEGSRAPLKGKVIANKDHGSDISMNTIRKVRGRRFLKSVLLKDKSVLLKGQEPH